MKMSRIEAAVVEEMPFAGVQPDRVHPDTEHKVSRAGRPKINALAPDGLSPSDGLVLCIEEANLPALLQKENADERKRKSDNDSREQPLPTKTDRHYHRARDQESQLRRASDGEE